MTTVAAITTMVDVLASPACQQQTNSHNQQCQQQQQQQAPFGQDDRRLNEAARASRSDPKARPTSKASRKRGNTGVTRSARTALLGHARGFARSARGTLSPLTCAIGRLGSISLPSTCSDFYAELLSKLPPPPTPHLSRMVLSIN